MSNTQSYVPMIGVDMLHYAKLKTDTSESYETETPIAVLNTAAAGFCLRVFEWYRRDCTKISSVSKADGNGKARLRELYKTFFDGWGILPTELAKQPPQLLFGVLYGADENGEISDEVKILYGL